MPAPQLNNNLRYLQLAFNYDINLVRMVLPHIPKSDRILIEAGTPYIKREGMNGVRLIRRLWPGQVVADLKVADGALGEVNMAHQAGATAATILGTAPTESLNLFIDRCKTLNMLSMIDLIAVDEPLDVLRPLRTPPDVCVIHRGRDEESTQGKMIQYRQVKRIRSKFNTFIAAAGGVDLREARSAIFNGANIVVANLVHPDDNWKGIKTTDNIAEITRQFLETIS